MAENERMIDVTDETFERDVLKSTLPVLVDFWAVWCGPCKMLEPTVAAIAEEYAGRAVVARLNVDENPETAGRYGIKGIPTLILFKDGEEKDRIIGVVPKERIADMINRHL
ncbi:MAG: thioredoxin [Acidobacteria bacterium]|nr:MAG: thioredoxin [Acidobacteriota bacterium]